MVTGAVVTCGRCALRRREAAARARGRAARAPGRRPCTPRCAPPRVQGFLEMSTGILSLPPPAGEGEGEGCHVYGFCPSCSSSRRRRRPLSWSTVHTRLEGCMLLSNAFFTTPDSWALVWAKSSCADGPLKLNLQVSHYVDESAPILGCSFVLGRRARWRWRARRCCGGRRCRRRGQPCRHRAAAARRAAPRHTIPWTPPPVQRRPTRPCALDHRALSV